MSAPSSTPAQGLGWKELGFGVRTLDYDEDQPEPIPRHKKAFVKLLSSCAFPVQDINNQFSSNQAAVAFREKFFPDLPAANVLYADMTTDAALSQLAFSGLGCHYTKEEKNSLWHNGTELAYRYVSDFSALESVPVRSGYERYGAIGYFSADLKPVAIYWSHMDRFVVPSEKDWEHAKLVWRSTSVLQVTLVDHLVKLHLVEANSFCNLIRKRLSPSHPLRVFFKPFTYQTVTVNTRAALSLLNERGLAHRIWAFDYNDIATVIDKEVATYKFRPLNDLKPLPKGVRPLDDDLSKYWEITHEFVSGFFAFNLDLNTDRELNAFCDELFNELRVGKPAEGDRAETLIAVLTHLICAVTCWHEHIGHLSDYVQDPVSIATKLDRTQGDIQTVQTYTQLLALVSVTGFHMPGILEDWSHLIPDTTDSQLNRNIDLYFDFKEKLLALSEEVDKRNARTSMPCNSFNARNIQCSVSV
jgi:hypothetical protein